MQSITNNFFPIPEENSHLDHSALRNDAGYTFGPQSFHSPFPSSTLGPIVHAQFDSGFDNASEPGYMTASQAINPPLPWSTTPFTQINPPLLLSPNTSSSFYPHLPPPPNSSASFPLALPPRNTSASFCPPIPLPLLSPSTSFYPPLSLPPPNFSTSFYPHLPPLPSSSASFCPPLPPTLPSSSTSFYPPLPPPNPSASFYPPLPLPPNTSTQFNPPLPLPLSINSAMLSDLPEHTISTRGAPHVKEALMANPKVPPKKKRGSRRRSAVLSTANQRKKSLRELERAKIMQKDEYILSFTETTATCAGCMKKIKLDSRDGARFYPGFWYNHKRRCQTVKGMVSTFFSFRGERCTKICAFLLR